MSPDNFDELMRIQRRMQKKIEEERQVDNTVDFMMLINEIAPHSGQKIQKEKLLIEGSMRGYTETYINDMINKLIRERMLFMPEPGYVQRR